MPRRILALLFGMLAVAASTAKGDICVGDTFKVSSVVGHVIAPWPGNEEEPVANVRVELKQWQHDELKTKFATFTDATGWFHFDNVTSGHYTIVFTPEHFYGYGAFN